MISSTGSIASATSCAERRGGPTSRGGPSVLPMRLSHKPPGSNAAATHWAKRERSSGSSQQLVLPRSSMPPHYKKC
jgi:hypothetical protein